MGIDVTVAAPVVTATATALDPPKLYVGLDLDLSPFRTPVQKRMGWRVPGGLAVSVTVTPVTATITEINPSVGLRVDDSTVITAAEAVTGIPAPTIGVSYTVTVDAAQATADTPNPSL